MCARVYSELEKKEDIYHSMLAEAYFVLLLYTVVELYGKPSADVEEDYRCGPGGEGWLGEGGLRKAVGGRGGGLQVQASGEDGWGCLQVQRGRMAGGTTSAQVMGGAGGWGDLPDEAVGGSFLSCIL